MTIGTIYLGLFLLGVVYALLSTLAGWLGDLGHHDGAFDAGGHVDGGHAHPLSGTVVATFITGFGGGGILAHFLFDWSLPAGLAFATASGVLLGGVAFLILELIFRQTEAGSEFRQSEVSGREAAVITAIPAAGTGEVAFTMRGQRELSAARSLSGEPIAKGQVVVIERVMGSTAYVKPKPQGDTTDV